MAKQLSSSDAHMRDKLPAVLHRAHHAIYLYINDALAASGITFQQAVVIFFVHYHKGCNQKAVEEHIETRSASVTVLLNTMASKGLIQKTRNPVDARGVVLSLTAKGQRAFTKIAETFNKTITEITKGLSEEEIEELKRMLRVMENNCRSATERPSCMRDC